MASTSSSENLTTTPVPSTTSTAPNPDLLTGFDGGWILKNAFTVMTMQSGFGLLEVGCVSSKSSTSIMMKNVMDVVFGGLTYWMVGYGLSFGPHGNGFIGWGRMMEHFFVTAQDDENTGQLYATYIFQFSFASAATTIVSGAIAERMRMLSYILFSIVSIPIYAIPAYWAWGDGGFLSEMGFYDFAGAGVVHMGGGASALAATAVIGPRYGRFGDADEYKMASPITALTGTLALWWAWLSFNCGSTFKIVGDNWKTAAKVSVTTINGSMGGTLAVIILDSIIYRKERILSSLSSAHAKVYHIFSIGHTCTGILSGLVAVTACCPVVSPLEAIFIGAIGGLIGVSTDYLLIRCKIDDPVASIPVHFFAGIWGTIAVGIFGQKQFDHLTEDNQQGLIYSGSARQLGVQALGVLVISFWWIFWTAISFYAFKYTPFLGLRVTKEYELIGADYLTHRIGNPHQHSKEKDRAARRQSRHPLAITADIKTLVQQSVREVLQESMIQEAIINRVQTKAMMQLGGGSKRGGLGGSVKLNDDNDDNHLSPSKKGGMGKNNKSIGGAKAMERPTKRRYRSQQTTILRNNLVSPMNDSNIHRNNDNDDELSDYSEESSRAESSMDIGVPYTILG